MSRPEKSLHILLKNPISNLQFKYSPKYDLQLIIFALPMKAEVSSAEEQLNRK